MEPRIQGADSRAIRSRAVTQFLIIGIKSKMAYNPLHASSFRIRNIQGIAGQQD
jgi:hypothetical protein